MPGSRRWILWRKKGQRRRRRCDDRVARGPAACRRHKAARRADASHQLREAAVAEATPTANHLRIGCLGWDTAAATLVELAHRVLRDANLPVAAWFAMEPAVGRIAGGSAAEVRFVTYEVLVRARASVRAVARHDDTSPRAMLLDRKRPKKELRLAKMLHWASRRTGRRPKGSRRKCSCGASCTMAGRSHMCSASLGVNRRGPQSLQRDGVGHRRHCEPGGMTVCLLLMSDSVHAAPAR